MDETPGRKRDAAATRAAILDSARKAFAEAGYDGAGVREIATGAGVTAMLVNRYFGSKEGLFGEALAATMASPVILQPGVLAAADVPSAFAKALVAVTDPNTAQLDGFPILLHSASNARIAGIGREQVQAHHLKNLTDALEGDDVELRAALALSLVAGVQVMRQMLRLDALAMADEGRLAALLEAMLCPVLEPD